MEKKYCIVKSLINQHEWMILILYKQHNIYKVLPYTAHIPGIDAVSVIGIIINSWYKQALVAETKQRIETGWRQINDYFIRVLYDRNWFENQDSADLRV